MTHLQWVQNITLVLAFQVKCLDINWHSRNVMLICRSIFMNSYWFSDPITPTSCYATFTLALDLQPLVAVEFLSSRGVRLFSGTSLTSLCVSVRPTFPVQLLPYDPLLEARIFSYSSRLITQGLSQNRWKNPRNIWRSPPRSRVHCFSLLESALVHSRHSRERLNIACSIVFTLWPGQHSLNVCF